MTEISATAFIVKTISLQALVEVQLFPSVLVVRLFELFWTDSGTLREVRDSRWQKHSQSESDCEWREAISPFSVRDRSTVVPTRRQLSHGTQQLASRARKRSPPFQHAHQNGGKDKSRNIRKDPTGSGLPNGQLPSFGALAQDLLFLVPLGILLQAEDLDPIPHFFPPDAGDVDNTGRRYRGERHEPRQHRPRSWRDR